MGEELIFDAIRWSYRGPLTGVQAMEPEGLPSAVALSNYPNPFNPVTRLRITLPAGAMVRLEISNILGQRVAVPLEGWMEGGVHDVPWDATGLSSGMYVARLRALGEGPERSSMITRTLMLTR